MKKISLAIIAISTLFIQHSHAQHIDIDKKALAFLSSEEKINIEFTYNNLFFNADNIPEDQYLKEIEAKNKEKYGDEGVEDWMDKYNTSKAEKWPEYFTTTLNAKMQEYENGPEFIINDQNLKYTLKVNTDWIYFGYNVVAAKWPSKVNMSLAFYETSNPEQIIFDTNIRRAMGKNNEAFKLDGWAKFERVGKAYVKGAYKLAQAFKRIVD